MSWAGHVTRMGDRRGAYRVLVGRLEGKRQLGRPRLCGTFRIWICNGLTWFRIGTGGGLLSMR